MAGKKVSERRTDLSKYRLRDPAWATVWADSIATKAECVFCPDFSFAGTAEECRAEAKTHRRAQHPGLRDRGQRERQKAAQTATRSLWA